MKAPLVAFLEGALDPARVLDRGCRYLQQQALITEGRRALPQQAHRMALAGTVVAVRLVANNERRRASAHRLRTARPAEHQETAGVRLHPLVVDAIPAAGLCDQLLQARVRFDQWV